MIRNITRSILSKLDHSTQTYIINALSYIPVLRNIPPMNAKRWVREEYTNFNINERRRIFMGIARFAHINRPIEGYYLEFGSHEANSMRMAWDCFQYLFNWDFVAFDSFEGLPDMEDYDRSTIFTKGNLATTENEFIRRVTNHGMPRDKLITVKGFYDVSLTEELRKRILKKKAAVIYIDCDLYKSTVPVLEFIVPFLQLGTVIVFDDWNCYHSQPDYGERRAWTEFLNRHQNLKFENFVSTAEAMSLVCVDAGNNSTSNDSF